MCLVLTMMLCCCCCRSKRVLEDENMDVEEPFQPEPVPDRVADLDCEDLQKDDLNESVEYEEEQVNVGIN